MKKGLLYISLQFGLIAFIFWRDGWLNKGGFDVLLHALGFALGIWAIAVMRNSKLNIFPEIRKGAKVVSKGPYQKIRHPMYTAVLLYFLPFVTNSVASALAYFGLLITLIFKLNYEEKLLKKAFPNYAAYCQKTHRLLPLIY